MNHHIEIVQKFVYQGRSFDSLQQIKTHIENRIGAILDQTPLRTDPKTALAIFKVLMENKAELVNLLSVLCEDENGNDINILDVKH